MQIEMATNGSRASGPVEGVPFTEFVVRLPPERAGFACRPVPAD